jgi:UDP-3-O-[3-hydroxymyristoyl] glucosamine N-acyltransferase
MLAILGSGNVAKQIALQCIAMGLDIVFVNPDPESEQGELIGGKHVKVLRDFKKPYPFIVGVSKPKSKVDLIFQALYNNWEPAKSIAHPSAIICSPLGFGGLVGAFTSIGEAVIGDYVTIESHCTVKHDSQIGNYSTIHSGSRVIGSTVSGLVSVGYNCVLHGVRVAPEMNITHGTTLKRT